MAYQTVEILQFQNQVVLYAYYVTMMLFMKKISLKLLLIPSIKMTQM